MCFVLPDWYTHARLIARQEIRRLDRLGARLDHDDAEQHAMLALLESLREARAPLANPWGFVRIVMRWRLGNLVRAQMKHTRGRTDYYARDDETGEIKEAHTITIDPTTEIETGIALKQLADLVLTESEARDLVENVRQSGQGNAALPFTRTRTTSRETDRVRRDRFAALARRCLARRYD